MSATWGGAAASLVPRQDSFVYGSAVMLTEEELSHLDKFEGGYHKEYVEIFVLQSGDWKPMCATVYIANTFYWTVPPSKAYLTAIHINLREQFGETMPECAHHIHIYGVFSKQGNTNVSEFRNSTAISHKQGHSDISSEAHDEVLANTIAVARSSDVLIEHLSTWTYPGSESLSLPALCVEVNARRAVKWVMPRTMSLVLDELKAQGIQSSAQLAARLASKVNFVALEYVDEEALDIFRVLLKLQIFFNHKLRRK